MIRESTRYLALKEDEPPPKKLLTERDILVKNLSQKQLNTDINIERYLNHQKVFENNSSKHIPLTACHSGGSSLKEFKDVINKVEYVEYLRSAGLESDEITLLVDYQQNNLNAEKYRNIEKSILKDRIEKVLKIVKEFEEKKDVDEKLCLKSCMDDIKDLEKNRFSHLNDEFLNPKRVQKRIRNINTRITKIGKSDETNLDGVEDKKLSGIDRFVPQYVEESKWDSKIPEDFQKSNVKTSKRTIMCAPKNYYTIRDGKIVNLNQTSIQEKCSLEINGNKLSLEDIKKLPKFTNYNPGEVSNVLYLKNLPKSIKESDLKEIFMEFPKVTFKVMMGRMKGQVFATFLSSNEASLALENLNGLLINGKPMVIAYGKNGNV